MRSYGSSLRGEKDIGQAGMTGGKASTEREQKMKRKEKETETETESKGESQM